MSDPADAPRPRLRVVVVNGSPHAASKTMGLASLITDTLADHLAIDVHRVDVYSLGSGFSDVVERELLSDAAEQEVRTAETADLLIAATPVYRGAYSGLFKHFFDLVDQYALANKPVLLTATGGSDRHALVIEHVLRPLFGFFQAAVAPVGFYASAGDFDGTMPLNAEVYSRVEIGLADIVPWLRLSTALPDIGAAPST